jgi:hypothetical protein
MFVTGLYDAECPVRGPDASGHMAVRACEGAVGQQRLVLNDRDTCQLGSDRTLMTERV